VENNKYDQISEEKYVEWKKNMCKPCFEKNQQFKTSNYWISFVH